MVQPKTIPWTLVRCVTSRSTERLALLIAELAYGGEEPELAYRFEWLN